MKMSLSRFLEGYKETIRQQVIEDFRPLYSPERRKEFIGKAASLKRRPYAAQLDAIAGLVLALKRQRSAFLVGEMGCGKTGISIAAASFLGMKNTLILCPPHLVGKWEKEIKATLFACEVIQVRSITGLLRSYASPADHPRFFILSRERAKLSYRWKPAVCTRKRLSEEKVGRKRREAYRYLACPSCFTEIKDQEGIPLTMDQLEKRKHKCRSCQGPLWEADRLGVRRYAIADFIKLKMKGAFSALLIDELHEFKAKGSAQGLAAASLAGAARKVLALTGTLFGGYSTTLFHLLYRLTPDIKKIFHHNEEIRWASRYGILERTFKLREGEEHREDGSMSRRRAYCTRVSERPGISPEVMFHLIDKCVFLRLSDLAVRLPPYEEEVRLLEMDPDQRDAYRQLARELTAAIKRQLARGNKSLLGAYLQALLSYPDQPFREETVIDHETSEVLARAPALPEDRVYPKERQLIGLVKGELSSGGNVLIYVTHTETRDLTGRLRNILKTEEIEASVLKSHTVSSENREAWIAARIKEGLRVLIAQTRLLQTGVDLLDFPTIIFYEPEYSVYTLRQAARRSWRIGQHQPVKVYFLAYRETLQERGLRLIAAKMRSALALEGDLLDEGLSTFNEDQDFFLQLARSIIAREPDCETTLDGGIAHPSGMDQELSQCLSNDSTIVGEPVTTNGHGAVTQPPEPERTPIREVPQCPEHQREAPLLTSLEQPDQLALF